MRARADNKSRHDWTHELEKKTLHEYKQETAMGNKMEREVKSRVYKGWGKTGKK